MHKSVNDFRAWAAVRLGDCPFEDVLEALRRVSMKDLLSPDWMHRHVLGFVQLRLPSVDGREIRLHHWTTGGDFAEEPHTHLWDLTSVVLLGQMTSVEFALSKRKGRSHLYAVKPNSGGDGTDRVDTGQVAEAVETSRRTYRRGDCYTVPQGAFHVSLSAGESVTAIVTSPPKVQYPTVVAEPDSSRLGHARLTPTSVADRLNFRRALERAMQ
jgi:hypothetical protein